MGDEIRIGCHLNPCYSTRLAPKAPASLSSGNNGRGKAAASEEQRGHGENKATHVIIASVHRNRPIAKDPDSEVSTYFETNSPGVKPLGEKVNKRLIVFFICTAIACAAMSCLSLIMSMWFAMKPSPTVTDSGLTDMVSNQPQQVNQALTICKQNVFKSDLVQLNKTSTEIYQEVLTLSEMINLFKSKLDHLNETLTTTEVGQRVGEMFVTLNQLKEFFLEHTTVFECGPGLWRRVAYIDMTLPSHQCPPAWREYTSPVRSCGRLASPSGSCASAEFETHNATYSRVCGRATGYQLGTPNAFLNLDRPQPMSVDENYIDGVSVTHGTPRTHVWTLVGGRSTRSDDRAACPCDNPRNAPSSPSFVSNSYFCESGGRSAPNDRTFALSNKLWDGTGCTSGMCCTFNSPPWFSVELPSSTTNDIEVRICGDNDTDDEDTPIEFLEIYVH